MKGKDKSVTDDEEHHVNMLKIEQGEGYSKISRKKLEGKDKKQKNKNLIQTCQKLSQEKVFKRDNIFKQCFIRCIWSQQVT